MGVIIKQDRTILIIAKAGGRLYQFHYFLYLCLSLKLPITKSIFLILHLWQLTFRPSEITYSGTWCKWSGTSQPQVLGTTVCHWTLEASGQWGGLWLSPPAPPPPQAQRAPTVPVGWGGVLTFSPGAQSQESFLLFQPLRIPRPLEFSVLQGKSQTHVILRGPTQDAGFALYALPLVGLDGLSHVQGEL